MSSQRCRPRFWRNLSACQLFAVNCIGCECNHDKWCPAEILLSCVHTETCVSAVSVSLPVSYCLPTYQSWVTTTAAHEAMERVKITAFLSSSLACFSPEHYFAALFKLLSEKKTPIRMKMNFFFGPLCSKRSWAVWQSCGFTTLSTFLCSLWVVPQKNKWRKWAPPQCVWALS